MDTEIGKITERTEAESNGLSVEEGEKGGVFARFSRRFPKGSAFLKRRAGSLSALAIVFAMFMIQLAVSGVYPFGTDYVLASYDLSAQICPFIEHLFDVLDGKSSLFYSYAIAGGADVFGSLAYFFISPFSFLFLLFGDGNVYNACGIVLALKLSAAAFAGARLAEKHCKNLPAYLVAALGVVYAYCGYTFVANTYINWMDFLVYLPFCASAFIRFSRTGKFLPFSVLLSCCIYTCFSIACFSLFTVFPVLVSYGLICVEKGKKKTFIAYLCLAFFVSVLIASPLLATALAAFLKSGRNGGLFDELWYGFTTENGKRVFDVVGYFDRSGEAIYRKASYLFSDSVFVVLTIVYFVRSKLRTPLSKFMLVAGICTLVPVVADEAMLLMNMGSYMSYALRFGFLNALYFFGGACLALNGVSYSKNTAYDGSLLPIDEKKRRRSLIVNAVVALVCAVALAVFVAGDLYLNLWDRFIRDSTILESMQAFSARFDHSLGGLQVTAVLFAIVGVAASVIFTSVRRKRLGARAASLLMIFVVAVQVLFYNEQLVVGNAATHYNINHYKTMSAQLSEREDGYFRIKDYNDKVTANIPFTGDSNSFSVFSSVIDRDNFEVGTLFGYGGNEKNSLKSYGGNAFGDAFLGYKYFFVNAESPEAISVPSYTRPVTVENGNGEEIGMNSGSFYMYENELTFPLGYTVADGEFRFVAENTSSNRAKNQLALYEFLGGSASGTSVSVTMVRALSAKLWDRAAEVTVGKEGITAKATATEGEYLFMSFVASEGYTVTVNGKKAELVENDLHFISVRLEEGENVVELRYSSPYARGFALTAAVALVLLAAVALIVRKTSFMKKTAPAIAAAGIALAAGLVLFFMAFPTAVWLVKLFFAAKTKLAGLF